MVGGSSTSAFKTATKPDAVTLVKVSSGTKKATLNWKKVSGANGYQIVYSTKKDFSSNKKTVTVSDGATVKKTVSSLTGGKTYYFKIRAYITVDDSKTYGSYSSVKSIKIKSNEKPNFTTIMSNDFDANCNFVFIIVENKGKSTIRFYSKNAILMDADYPSYDRYLTLIDYDYWNETEGGIKEVSYVDVKAGKETVLLFKVKGASTWYDSKSEIGMEFKYNETNYLCTVSNKYGLDYWQDK